MRHAYLNPTHSDNCMRGGVSSEHGDYELEIGGSAICSTEMLSMCTLYDEIREFMELSQSPIAKMILAKWAEEQGRLDGILEKKYAR